MRALRALSLMVVLPMLAWAGWRPVTTITPATPIRDLQLLDAGVVLTVSSNSVSVWGVNDAGVSQIATLAGTNLVGGGYYAPSCVLAMSGPLGSADVTGTCGAPTNLSMSDTAVGFRLLSSPPLAIAILATGTNQDTLWRGPGAATGWTQTPGALATGSSLRTLQTRQIGGIDYAAINTGSPNSLFMSVDGGSATRVASGMSWRDATPLLLSGAPAVLGVVSDAGAGLPGLVLVPDYRNPMLRILSSPAGIPPRFVSSSGLASMATTSTTTGTVLAPIPNPARPFETWVVRSGPDGGIGGKVDCTDDHGCVSSNDAGVVWLWTNDVAPTVSFVMSALPDGGTRLFADAGDGDGDPIFVSWDAGPGAALTAVAGIEDGTQIDLTLPSTCAAAAIEAVVTDGLPGHERSASLALPLPRGEFGVSGPLSVPSGSGAVSFSTFVDGGCGEMPNQITWLLDGGTGSTFSFIPPRNECNADGGLVTITANASWQNSPNMTSASQQILVEPWGPPETPSFDGGDQLPGTTVDWLATDVEHVCTGSNGFPGTVLAWTIDPGGVDPNDIDELPNGLRIKAPRVCFDLQVTGTASRQLVDGGQSAGSGTLVVNIPADVAPLDMAEFSISVNGDAGKLFGELSVDAGCLFERGVSAVVTASNGDSTTSPFPASGPWTWKLNLAGGCLGGTFNVDAQLIVDGGTVKTAQGSFTLPFSPVVVGTQSISQLDVTCGEGAHGTVALMPVPNSCASADVQWRASGAALVTSSGTGESFELQTQALDFTNVGQQLTIDWTADAGAGNGDSATYTIDLAVQPFLQIVVENRPPLRREEEAMTMRISLRNPTSCPVDGLSVLLPLSGATPIGDTVLIGGAKVSGRTTDEGLVIDGVGVAANGESIIELSVRPRLLSTPSAAPVASLNGYVVSTQLIPEKGGTGCGCSTADLSMMLGVLLLIVRRRRA